MRTVVIEDSRLAREGLLRMLKNYSELDIVGSAENVEEALDLIGDRKPDLLFLDINMPGESGFELLELINYDPKVIFTTAHADFAVKSFEYNTIDYLLKPIRQDRLSNAISKLSLEKSCDEDGSGSDEVLETDSRIFVKDDSSCHLVEISKIDYIESCKNHVILFFEGKKAFVKKSLNQAEKRLPSKIFFRANRQFIVNLKSITDIELSVGDGYFLTMKDGKTLEVSRRNSILLKELLSL